MFARSQSVRALAFLSLGALAPLAVQAQETTVLQQGAFVGASDHATSGSAAIVEQGGKFYVSLGADFDHDGTAPDAKVAMGRDGYAAETLLGALKSATGAQTYEIPAGIDPGDYDQVWIWCEQFDVPLGLAELE